MAITYDITGSELGSESIVTFSGFVGVGVQRVRAAFKNVSGSTIDCEITNVTGKSVTVSWTPPVEWAKYCAVATSITISFTISVLVSSSYSKTYTCDVPYTIPSNVSPTVSFTLADSTGVYDTHGVLAQNVSTLVYDIAAEGVYGSTITDYRLTAAIGPNVLYNQVKCSSSGVIHLPYPGAVSVKIEATDSRGRSAYATNNSFEVAEYGAAQVNIGLYERCDEDGTYNETGNFGHVNFRAQAYKISSVAEIDYTLKYRLKNTVGDYESISITELKNNIDVHEYTIIIPLESSEAYNVQIAVSDSLSETSSAIVSIPAINVLLDIDKSTNSMGIGAVADIPNTLVIGYNTVFRGKTNLTPCKRNLLDNSDFTNPVNQRDITELNVTETTPFIDRWLAQPTGSAESAHAEVHPIWLSTTPTTPVPLYNKISEQMSTNAWAENTSSTGEVSWGGGYVYLGNTSSSSGYASIYTPKPFDVTDYKTLRVTVDNLTVGNRLIVGVCSKYYTGTSSTDAVSNFSASTVITASYTPMQAIDVDISQVTGSMYIQICAGITKVNVYSVDLVGETVATLNDNPYVSVENGALAQRLEAYKKDTEYTLIACSTDSDDYFVNIEEFNADSEYLTLVNDIPTVLLPAGSWKWAALYEGSYNLYNLPSYQPKGYGNELMECHRYYRRFTTNSRPETVAFYGKFNTDKTHIYMQFPVDPPMRATPTASITGGVIVRSPTGSKISEATPTVPYTELNCTADSARVNNLIISKTDASVWSGATADYSCAVTLAANSVIELSAEL